MARSSVLVDLDDPRTAKIADVISNKTCKKILQIISEREMSESEISSELKIPINTVDYNIKKLYEAGLVQQSKKFLWSEKGKRIYYYKISDKRIVISPKYIVRGIVPAFVASIAGALGIYYWFWRANEMAVEQLANSADISERSSGAALYAASNVVNKTTVENIDAISGVYSPWIWFLIGAWLAIIFMIAWNRRR